MQFHIQCQFLASPEKLKEPGNTKIKRLHIKELARTEEMQSRLDGVSIPECGQMGGNLFPRAAEL